MSVPANKKKVLFLTNIPSPYRIDFFNELGKYVDLTVVFEARRLRSISFNWNDNDIKFDAHFLSEHAKKKVKWKVLNYIKVNEYDFCFMTNYAYYTELVALLKIKLLRIPYILEIDGALVRNENILKKMVKRFLIKGAKSYFSPSKTSDEVLVNYGVSKLKIKRYPFTSIREINIRKDIASEAEKKSLRKELDISEENVILCVGQFIYRKGNDILITAAHMLPEGVGIYFVGGDITDEYEILVRKYGLTNIHFIEFQSSKTLNKYYDAADLFVLATREDVWGLVINEAMSHGLPIITTNKCVAGIELVNDNGILIPVNDVNSLAESIKKILYNKELLNDMGRKSLQYIRKYTIEEMVREHINYFEGYDGRSL